MLRREALKPGRSGKRDDGETAASIVSMGVLFAMQFAITQRTYHVMATGLCLLELRSAGSMAAVAAFSCLGVWCTL